MPIFEFVCTDCNNAFEVLLRGAEEAVCPACQGRRLQKQISLPAPQGKSKSLVAGARRQAAREGHFSNYASSELPRRK